MQDKITLAIDALASAAFVEGGVSPENTQAARDLTEQRKRELLAAIGAPCLHQIQEPEADIWPCVNIDVDESGKITNAKLYSPGLPAGNHDVYPVRVPYMDEHTEAWLACAAELRKHLPEFMHLRDMNGIECAVAAIRELAERSAPVLAAQPAVTAALFAARGAIQHLKEGGKPTESLLNEAIAAIDSVATSEAAPAAVAVPDAVTDEMVHAALRVQHPNMYREYLRHPANGPAIEAKTEKEIDTARKMIAAALAATPAAVDYPTEADPATETVVTLEAMEAWHSKDRSAAVPADHDDEDLIAVPRGLLGAARGAIARKADAPSLLEKLRRYTTGDLSTEAKSRVLSTAAAPVVLPPPDLWRDDEGLRGYAADPGRGPWYTADTVRALLAGVSAPAAVAVTAPTAQDSCCAWSVWWTHEKAKHTTMRQASIAAWDAGVAYALERTAPQTQADARDAEQYRLLLRGQDTIEADDEFLREDGVTWRKDPSGIFVGMIYEGNILLPARRAIAAQAAKEQQ